MNSKPKKKPARIAVAAKRKKFIELMVDAVSGDDMIDAYQAVYPQCKKRASARVRAYELLQNADIKSEIEKKRQEKENEIRQAQKEERIRLAREQVAHEAELDAELSKIAMGTKTRKKKVVVWNRAKRVYETVTVQEEPTETDQIAAADKLYKRKGSYAPTTLKHEGGDTFIDFIKALAKTTNKNIPDVFPGGHKQV